jgi:hypothetical protein|tara:strand:- start:16706 stop:16942 length:237 start_codon:yes stop_codon:yes gene_type:complete
MKFSKQYAKQLSKMDDDLKEVAIAMYETHKGFPFYIVAQKIDMNSVEFYDRLVLVKKLLGIPAGPKRQSFEPGGPIWK